MRKIACAVCFVLFAFVCNAQDLKGIWELDGNKASLLKSSTRPDDNKVSADIAKVETEYPRTIMFEDDYCTIIFNDNTSVGGAYQLKDGLLSIFLPDRIAEYNVTIQDGQVRIKRTKNAEGSVMFTKINNE